MKRYFNQLFCCHTDAKEIIENKPVPFVVSQKEKEEETITTTFLSPLEESISSFFHTDENKEMKETKENESIDFLETVEKTISTLLHEETKEPEKENHSICSFVHLHSTEEEKSKPKPNTQVKENHSICSFVHLHSTEEEKSKPKLNTQVNKTYPFSWTDSVFIYFHPNLLLDKYLSEYIQWKTEIWKEKIKYPYSLYVVCSVFLVGTSTCLYYYFNK